MYAVAFGMGRGVFQDARRGFGRRRDWQQHRAAQLPWAAFAPAVVTRQGVTAAKPSISPAPGTPALSGGDPVVRDDLGEPIPVTAAEVDVIETYLGPLLDELLGSHPGSESRQA
jgi:hypothetical protein